MNFALPLRMLGRDWRGVPKGGAGAPRLRGDGATERGASGRASVESPQAAAPLAKDKGPALRGGTLEASGGPPIVGGLC